MFRSLLYEARTWRSRLLFYWLSGEKSNLAFFAMLGLPIGALGCIVYLAYADRTHVEVTSERDVELRCLAENIYFEARGEPLDGQYAVAEVTLNRVASPYFPDTICEVVYEARWDPLRKRRVAHFSWTELKFRRRPRGAAWQQAMAVATAVYNDVHMPVVPDALFYHATHVDPYWAKTKKSVATIGSHVFYR